MGRGERPGSPEWEERGPGKRSHEEGPRAKPMVPGPGRHADVAGGEPAATEGQEAWTQGTVGVMLRGEEGDVGAGCGGVQVPGENESPWGETHGGGVEACD